MSAASRPPSRADHVGSLLRPPALETLRDELRRKSWHMDFLTQLGGLTSEGKAIPTRSFASRSR
jgi:methionine synthase II (cobalamin-independent)